MPDSKKGGFAMSPKNTAAVSNAIQNSVKTSTMSALDTLLSRNAMIWQRDARRPG